MNAAANIADSTNQASKWVSIGAAAAAVPTLIVMLWSIGGRADHSFFWHLALLFSFKLSSLLYMVFCLALAVVGAIAGARYICKKIGDPLLAYPAPVLVAAGFILGALVIVVGLVYVVLHILSAIASAF